MLCVAFTNLRNAVISIHVNDLLPHPPYLSLRLMFMLTLGQPMVQVGREGGSVLSLRQCTTLHKDLFAHPLRPGKTPRWGGSTVCTLSQYFWASTLGCACVVVCVCLLVSCVSLCALFDCRNDAMHGTSKPLWTAPLTKRVAIIARALHFGRMYS